MTLKIEQPKKSQRKEMVGRSRLIVRSTGTRETSRTMDERRCSEIMTIRRYIRRRLNLIRWNLVTSLLGEELEIKPLYQDIIIPGEIGSKEWETVREQKKRELAGLVTIIGKPGIPYGVWRQNGNMLKRCWKW